MANFREGTGSNCNCSEELVKLFMSKLSAQELERLDRSHADVVLDSIAEAYKRKENLMRG